MRLNRINIQGHRTEPKDSDKIEKTEKTCLRVVPCCKNLGPTETSAIDISSQLDMMTSSLVVAERDCQGLFFDNLVVTS